METVRVFLSSGQVLAVTRGTRLLEALVEGGTNLDSPCGGRGKCGRCTTLIRYSEAGAIEAVLACSYLIDKDIWVHVPGDNTSSTATILTTGIGLPVALNPGITKHYIGEGVAGYPSFWAGLKEKAAGLGLFAPSSLGLLQGLARLGTVKPGAPFTLVNAGGQVIDVELGDTREECFGLAVDIGTTTVVGYLLNLLTGEQVAVDSGLNGQRVYGADVISRINMAKSGENQLKQIQARVIETINGIVANLTEKSGVAAEKIYGVTLVGNTCMHHLVLGLSPGSLGRAPFTHVFGELLETDAHRLKLAVNPQARVWALPVVAGFVGGDTVGAIMACDLHRLSGVKMLVDIGTNGEIVINAHRRLLATSAAAGPALEGAEISCGMRAETGAISKVRLGPEIDCQVIGTGPVKGICGSGLVDLMAELINWKLVNVRGRLVSADKYFGPEELKKRLVKGEKGVRFILRWASENQGQEIYLSQQDITQLQLSKGALRTAMELLRAKLGLQGSEVEEVLLAGAFGNFLGIEQALQIGLLPPWAQGKVRAIGNAAGEGAKMALLSADKRKEAAQIAQGVEFLELAGTKEFKESFVKAMLFDQAK
ncbi:MAG TPA: ASKHA domain-containing protein [Bacillota bacterium]|nr:ASKHA domain-containing protein [Bacillota bacterium]